MRKPNYKIIVRSALLLLVPFIIMIVANELMSITKKETTGGKG